MKAEKFVASLNNIQDKYLEEAATFGEAANAANQANRAAETVAFTQATAEKDFQKAAANKTRRAMKVWRVVAIAACALLAIGVAATTIGLAGRRGDSKMAAGGAYYENAAEGYAPSPGKDSYFLEDSADAAYDGDSDYFTGNNAAPEYYEDGAVSEESAGGELAAGSGPLTADSGSTGTENGLKTSDGITTMVPADENAKIIYTAFLSIDTTEFEAAQAKIEDVTKAHNAYFSSLDQSGDSYSLRSAYYEIRVPAEEFDGFIKDAQSFGTITSISQNAADVSEDYYDIESRLETAKTKLQRLNELLSQAQDMTDIITIENEISNVQWEIDDLSGSLKYYDSQVRYSTVTINLYEVYRTTDGDTPLSFGDRISKAFKDGVGAFAEGMQSLLLWLAANWLWLILILIVIAAAIIIPVKVSKRIAQKNSKDKD